MVGRNEDVFQKQQSCGGIQKKKPNQLQEAWPK